MENEVPKCICGRDCKKALYSNDTTAMNYGYNMTCGRAECRIGDRHKYPKKVGFKPKKIASNLSIIAQNSASATCHICHKEKSPGQQICDNCRGRAYARKKFGHRIFIKSVFAQRTVKDQNRTKRQQEAKDFFDNLSRQVKEELKK